MALSVPYRVDTKVSVPDLVGTGGRRSRELHPSVLGAVEMRGGGVKCTDGPHTFVGDDSTKGRGIGLCRNGEGSDGDPGFQSVPTCS
jgi:hypothetical protein